MRFPDLKCSFCGGFFLQLLQLLLKASQDKKFVCEEADKAVKTMVEAMTPLPLLQKLKAFVSHSNLRIRAKAAVSISRCISKMVFIFALTVFFEHFQLTY